MLSRCTCLSVLAVALMLGLNDSATAARPVGGSYAWWDSVVLNGQSLNTNRPILEVAPGQSISGSARMAVDFRGTSSWIVPVAGTVSWDRSEQVRVAGDMPSGVHTATYSLNQTAPASGSGWIYVGVQNTLSYHEILGCDVLPQYGGPAGGPYGNGNDVWDWTNSQFTQAWTGDVIDRDWNGNPGQALGKSIKVVTVPTSARQAPRDYATPSPEPRQLLTRLRRWDASGWVNVQPSDPVLNGKNIHVMTHGWSPGWKSEVDKVTPGLATAWNTPGSAKFLGAWEDLAGGIKTADPDSEILMYSWIDGSATDGSAWQYWYADDSRANTDQAASLLSAQLQSALGLDRSESIHLIGHSHGARVATLAAASLKNGVAGTNVEHLTLFDSPEFVIGGGDNLLWPDLYSLGIGTDVGNGDTFVDNYFSKYGRAYRPILAQINPLAPAVHDGLVDIELRASEYMDPYGTTAHSYPREWYMAAAANGASVGVNWSPWGSTPIDVLASDYTQSEYFEFVLQESDSRSIERRWTLAKAHTDEIRLENFQIESGTGIGRGTESSPAFWDMLLELDEDDAWIEFTYEFIDVGDGDQIGIWLDGDLRFLVTGIDVGMGIRYGRIPVDDLGSGTYALTVALHSYGEANAIIDVGDFQTASVIPEPVSLALLTLGGLALLRRRRAA